MAKREPGERWTCECGKPLVGARSKNGKVSPINVEPSEDGNVLLHKRAGEVSAWVLAGDTLAKAREAGVELRLNHWADCPMRDEYAQRYGR